MHESLSVGDNCLFGEFVSIHDEDHVLSRSSKPWSERGFITSPVRIGSGVWVGAHATILKGVTIGDHAVVAAGADVTPTSQRAPSWAGFRRRSWASSPTRRPPRRPRTRGASTRNAQASGAHSADDRPRLGVPGLASKALGMARGKPAALVAIGAASGQVITLLAAPILTRTYDEAAFGIYAVATTITAVVTILSTGQYRDGHPHGERRG